MYLKAIVKIPDVKGKVILKKRGASTYVLYQHGSDYNAERQYAVPRRTIVGKLDPERPGFMLPNEKFQEFFPDAVVVEELPEATRSCALKMGAYAVIDRVLSEYRLPKRLSRIFGEDAGLILDLVSYLLVDEDNAGQHYPDYAFDHPLFARGMRIFSDASVCRLLQRMTRDQVEAFLDSWNEGRDRRERIYISYDSTNKNGQAGDIDLLEFGHAKDDAGLPIFNLALAFDRTNSVPLFYESYAGSITDMAQLPYMVDRVREYGYRRVGFILDRGYFSKANIRHMEERGYAFIIMVKGCRRLVSSVVDELRHTFETDRRCAIRAYRVNGTTVRRRLYEDDTRERYFHLYFSPSRHAAEREALELQLDRMRLMLEKNLGLPVALHSSYEEFFELDYDRDGNLVSFRERGELVSRRIGDCGYFCIVTSEEMTAAQAIEHYKGRDISEKIFAQDKSFLGSRSMRVQSVESLSSKLFIEFLALIVRNRIYSLLKETALRLDLRHNYMTVPAALRELDKIELVRRSGGRYRLDHAVSKRQRTILGAFGMDDGSVAAVANRIANMLSSGDCPAEDTCSEEEDGYGTDPLDIID